MENVIWGALLLGPLFFFAIEEVGHGVLSLIVYIALSTYGIVWVAWIGYAFVAPRVVRGKWIRRGYESISQD